MKYARDFQRTKLYHWEDATLGYSAQPLDFETSKAFALHVWDMMQGHPLSKTKKKSHPKITDGRRSRSGMYFPATHRIRLPKRARRGWYIIHEVAHALLPATKTAAWHGSEFCALYAYMLQRFDNRINIVDSMQSNGLKVSE